MSAKFARRLWIQGVVTVTTGAGIGVGIPVSTPADGSMIAQKLADARLHLRMGRREPECRAHRDRDLVRAALLSLRSAPRLHGVASLCVHDETTEPPAHCQLVSSHDLFEIVASPDCIDLLHEFLMRRSGDNVTGGAVQREGRAPTILRSIPRGETRATFPAEPTGPRTRARPRRSRSAAGRPHERVALIATGKGARE